MGWILLLPVLVASAKKVNYLGDMARIINQIY